MKEKLLGRNVSPIKCFELQEFFFTGTIRAKWPTWFLYDFYSCCEPAAWITQGTWTSDVIDIDNALAPLWRHNFWRQESIEGRKKRQEIRFYHKRRFYKKLTCTKNAKILRNPDTHDWAKKLNERFCHNTSEQPKKLREIWCFEPRKLKKIWILIAYTLFFYKKVIYAPSTSLS